MRTQIYLAAAAAFLAVVRATSSTCSGTPTVAVAIGDHDDDIEYIELVIGNNVTCSWFMIYVVPFLDDPDPQAIDDLYCKDRQGLVVQGPYGYQYGCCEAPSWSPNAAGAYCTTPPCTVRCPVPQLQGLNVWDYDLDLFIKTLERGSSWSLDTPFTGLSYKTTRPLGLQVVFKGLACIVLIGAVLAGGSGLMDTANQVAKAQPVALIVGFIASTLLTVTGELLIAHYGISYSEVEFEFMKASLRYSASTLVFGPFLVFVPRRDASDPSKDQRVRIDASRRPCLARLVDALQSWPAKYLFIALFLICTLVQSLAARSFYLTLVYKYGADVVTTVSLVAWYAVLCLFYVAAFLSGMLDTTGQRAAWKGAHPKSRPPNADVEEAEARAVAALAAGASKHGGEGVVAGAGATAEEDALERGDDRRIAKTTATVGENGAEAGSRRCCRCCGRGGDAQSGNKFDGDPVLLWTVGLLSHILRLDDGEEGEDVVLCMRTKWHDTTLTCGSTYGAVYLTLFGIVSALVVTYNAIIIASEDPLSGTEGMVRTLQVVTMVSVLATIAFVLNVALVVDTDRAPKSAAGSHRVAPDVEGGEGPGGKDPGTHGPSSRGPASAQAEPEGKPMVSRAPVRSGQIGPPVHRREAAREAKLADVRTRPMMRREAEGREEKRRSDPVRTRAVEDSGARLARLAATCDPWVMNLALREMDGFPAALQQPPVHLGKLEVEVVSREDSVVVRVAGEQEHMEQLLARHALLASLVQVRQREKPVTGKMEDVCGEVELKVVDVSASTGADGAGRLTATLVPTEPRYVGGFDDNDESPGANFKKVLLHYNWTVILRFTGLRPANEGHMAAFRVERCDPEEGTMVALAVGDAASHGSHRLQFPGFLNKAIYEGRWQQEPEPEQGNLVTWHFDNTVVRVVGSGEALELRRGMLMIRDVDDALGARMGVVRSLGTDGVRMLLGSTDGQARTRWFEESSVEPNDTSVSVLPHWASNGVGALALDASDGTGLGEPGSLMPILAVQVGDGVDVLTGGPANVLVTLWVPRC